MAAGNTPNHATKPRFSGNKKTTQPGLLGRLPADRRETATWRRTSRRRCSWPPRARPVLGHHPVVGAWLFQTTRYEAIDAIPLPRAAEGRELAASQMRAETLSTPEASPGMGPDQSRAGPGRRLARRGGPQCRGASLLWAEIFAEIGSQQGLSRGRRPHAGRTRPRETAQPPGPEGHHLELRCSRRPADGKKRDGRPRRTGRRRRRGRPVRPGRQRHRRHPRTS